jgi:predicted ABC-type ATPase
VSVQSESPYVIVIGGPNGAGKSTSAPSLLKDSLEIMEFVNADTIAAGLSAFQPESVAIAAGRIMLGRMRHLADARENFAFETTLATRTLAPWLKGLQRSGYHVHLMFLWLQSAELAMSRVLDRVRAGGHDIPAEVVARRYWAGVRNLFDTYIPLANSWQVFDNSGNGPRLIAASIACELTVVDVNAWRMLKESRGD